MVILALQEAPRSRGRRENKIVDLCDAINNVAEAIGAQNTVAREKYI